MHVRGKEGVVKGLGATLQPSSHLLTRVFCPKAAGEQASAEERQWCLSSEQISMCVARQRAEG